MFVFHHKNEMFQKYITIHNKNGKLVMSIQILSKSTEIFCFIHINKNVTLIVHVSDVQTTYMLLIICVLNSQYIESS